MRILIFILSIFLCKLSLADRTWVPLDPIHEGNNHHKIVIATKNKCSLINSANITEDGLPDKEFVSALSKIGIKYSVENCVIVETQDHQDTGTLCCKVEQAKVSTLDESLADEIEGEFMKQCMATTSSRFSLNWCGGPH